MRLTDAVKTLNGWLRDRIRALILLLGISSVRWFFFLGFLATSLSVFADEPATKENLEFFESKIRPVLVRECYSCHSQEAAANGKLRGELLLDSRDTTRKGGESGPAVVPGKMADSLLLLALKHESFEMPPKGKLSDVVIADFEKWIENGAVDPRTGSTDVPKRSRNVDAGRSFWSFQPLATDVPPQVTDSAQWARTTIDRFILAASTERNLAPNPVADARVLVRRAWFDLLGLPPPPAELQKWVGRLTLPAGNQTNASQTEGINSEAWLNLIDELLLSPHYGERQARHWMDVVRFAESHGYEQDYDRPHAYHYRDFLIKAFNDDLPYDTFVQWQLAGDELSPHNPLAWMATGFLGAGAFPTQLTEAEFESARYDELDDMVATTGVAFLGLSVGCARCHDHKFDPIPSEDYYRLAATFATTIRSEKTFDLMPEENAQLRETYAQNLAQARAELARYERENLPSALVEWLRSESSNLDTVTPWQRLVGQVKSTGKSEFELQTDGAYLARGDAPNNDTVTLRATLENTTVRMLRLEALNHDSLPQKGPGRANNGNFALGNIECKIIDSKQQSSPSIKLTAARASYQQNSDSLSVAASIDDDPVSGWAVDGQIGQDQAAVFSLEQPLEIDAPSELQVTLSFQHPNPKHAIGRFRLSVSSQVDLEPSIGDVGPSPSVSAAIKTLKSKISGVPTSESASLTATHLQRSSTVEWPILFAWYKSEDHGWAQRSANVAKLESQSAGEKLSTVMVTSEGLPHLSHHADGRGFPHFYPVTYQLRRGDVHQKMEKVEPGLLQVLTAKNQSLEHWKAQPDSPNEKTSYRRATLARWITDAKTGAGTLTARVMANRLWQHHFGRGLVATPNDFGASGELPTHPQLLDYLATRLIDNNWQLKLLHREIMSSSVYMQSSALELTDSRLHRDPENKFYWRRTPLRLEAEAIRDSMLSVSGQLDTTMYGPGSLDETMRRRSVYFFIKRSQLIPTMMLFDWPEHLVSIGQRPSTTIAPQALMFINSPQGRSYATTLAKRVENGDQSQAIHEAYALALGREPAGSELQATRAFLQQQIRLRMSAGDEQPVQLALADLCQTLMSMNEFVYID